MSAPSAPNPAGASALGGATEHEFTAEESEVLRGFASAAVAWGALCAVAGAGCLTLLVLRALSVHSLGPAGLLLGVGVVVEWSLAVSFVGAGRAFLAAVHTAGSDITHAMRAMRFVSGAFLIQIGFAAISLATAIFAGGLGSLR